MALVAAAGQACGDTWYVDDNALLDPVHGDCTNAYPLENGRGWSSAFDSLKEAVVAASDGDTIMVANGVYDGTCAMNVTIDKDLTIRATNPCQAVFDGGGSSRAIRVDPGASVTIEGLRFVDCYKGFGGVDSGGAVFVNSSTVEFVGCCFEECGADASGGAVYLLGAHGTFLDCHFAHCSAPDDGGAIALHGGSLSIVGGSFDSCSADRGGGVYATGNITEVTSISFTGNNGSLGGAMHIVGASDLFMERNKFGTPGSGRNRATSDGGALYLSASTVTMLDCELRGNRAWHQGGAIWLGDDSTMVMEDCFAEANQADEGGGAVCAVGSDLSVIEGVGTSRITGCTANDRSGSNRGRGGAILCLSDGDGVRELVTVLDTDVTGCEAEYGGGAIYTEGPEVQIDGGEFRANLSHKGRGGAIRVDDRGELLATGVRFVGNRSEASDGGAIATSRANRVNLSWNEFDGNHAERHGGAVYSSDSWSPVFINGGSLSNNTSGVDGGAVRIEDEDAFTMDGVLLEVNQASGVGGAVSAIESNIVISGSILRDNAAPSSNGGAVAIQFGSVIIRDTSHWRNAAVNGGGLATADAVVRVEHSTFVDNDALSSGAGAYHTGTVLLTPEYQRVHFVDNDAILNGGGVYTFIGARFEHCEFLYNSGGSRGGAIDASSNAEVELAVENSVFVHNDADNLGGAISVSHLGSAWVRNCSFALNRATATAGKGGAVWMGDTNLASYNSVYWENTDGAGDVFTSQVYEAGSGVLDLAFCAFADYACPAFGVGVICLSPSQPPFVDPMVDDLRLRSDSFCIDAGHNELAGQNSAGELLMEDSDDEDRFLDDPCATDSGQAHTDPAYSDLPIIDMGAFESAGCTCIADWNDDGSVNTLDFLAYLSDWSAGNSRADINGDGAVNTLDFLAYLGLWSAGC